MNWHTPRAACGPAAQRHPRPPQKHFDLRPWTAGAASHPVPRDRGVDERGTRSHRAGPQSRSKLDRNSSAPPLGAGLRPPTAPPPVAPENRRPVVSTVDVMCRRSPFSRESGVFVRPLQTVVGKRRQIPVEAQRPRERKTGQPGTSARCGITEPRSVSDVGSALDGRARSPPPGGSARPAERRRPWT